MNVEKIRISLLISCSLFFLSVYSVKSQVLPVGMSENLEELARRKQLLEPDSSLISYMIRPLGAAALPSSSKKLTVLPIVWQNQYNTSRPYGMNDGSMISAKGYQTMISAGVFAKIGPLSVQFRPEFVFAENKDFDELYEENNGVDFSEVYARRVINGIDMPERFGEVGYKKAFWGQSSIKLTFDPVSFGFSTENLWWGPGIRSSLLMSNNAPGFKHFTLNTSRPVDIYVGTIEAQVIGGKLESSDVEVQRDPKLLKKRDDWRYLSGIVMTYQPKWVPGLYLGFDRSFVMYHKDLKSFGEYFPLFTPVAKNTFNNPDNTANSEDQTNRDQYISVFARWVMPLSKSEIYFQFGRNDHSWDLRDAFVEPEHSSAYIAGFRKLLPLKKADEFIQLGVEITRLAGASTGILRAQPSWYAHHQVRHGYTNSGQVIGAGIGPGSNLWSLDMNWVKGLKRIGLQVEHLVQNEDLFSFTANYGVKKSSDLSFSGRFDFNFKSFIFNSQLSYVRSSNYHYISGNNSGNFNAKIGCVYLIK